MPTTATRNAIHLATSKTVDQWDDEWARYARVEVGFSGTFDAERIRAALARCSKVVGIGSYRGTVAEVKDLGNGRLSYRVRYCDGD